MNESDLHARIYQRSADLAGIDGDILLGPGDDCAVVRTASGDALLVSTDQLIESRHYEPGTSIARIAHKAVARTLSDIAAMGGTARWMLAAAALPEGDPHADALFDAVAERARHWGAPLVGGDVSGTPGPPALVMTVIGEARAHSGPIRRSGARLGHGVYVTGALGGSLGSGRHLDFEPRLIEGRWLCETLGSSLGAMIDLSDGLGRDGGRIASASGATLEIDAARLPIHADAGSGGPGDGPDRDAWLAAIADGEDYELLFTAAGEVPEICPETGTPIARIGVVREPGEAGPTCLVRTPTGELRDAAGLGWDHGI